MTFVLIDSGLASLLVSEGLCLAMPLTNPITTCIVLSPEHVSSFQSVKDDQGLSLVSKGPFMKGVMISNPSHVGFHDHAAFYLVKRGCLFDVVLIQHVHLTNLDGVFSKSLHDDFPEMGFPVLDLDSNFNMGFDFKLLELDSSMIGSNKRTKRAKKEKKREKRDKREKRLKWRWESERQKEVGEKRSWEFQEEEKTQKTQKEMDQYDSLVIPTISEISEINPTTITSKLFRKPLRHMPDINNVFTFTCGVQGCDKTYFSIPSLRHHLHMKHASIGHGKKDAIIVEAEQTKKHADLVNCHCSMTVMSGYTVFCDRCQYFVHGECYNIGDGSLSQYDLFICKKCTEILKSSVKKIKK